MEDEKNQCKVEQKTGFCDGFYGNVVFFMGLLIYTLIGALVCKTINVIMFHVCVCVGVIEMEKN